MTICAACGIYHSDEGQIANGILSSMHSAVGGSKATWGHQAEGAAGKKLAVVTLDVIPAPYQYPVLAPPVLLLRLHRMQRHQTLPITCFVNALHRIAGQWYEIAG